MVGFLSFYLYPVIPFLIVLGIFILITVLIIYVNKGRKEYYKNLHAKDLMLDNLISNIPGGIAIYRIGSVIETIYSNEGIPSITGRTMEEYKKWIAGDLIANTVYFQDTKRMLEAFSTTLPYGKPLNITYRLNHKDGYPVWVQLSAVTIGKENGCFIYYAVYTKLTEESSMYESIINDISTAIYVCDMETYEILYTNKAMQSTNFCSDKYNGQKCYEYLMHFDKPCDFCKMECLSDDKYMIRDFFHEETKRTYSMSGKLIDWNGRKAHIEYVTDETENRRAEQKLKESLARYEIQMDLLSKVTADTIGNFRLNISKNICDNGYLQNEGINLLHITTDNMEELFNYIAGIIPNEDDRDNYSRTFTKDNLIMCYEEGQAAVSCEHRIHMGDGKVEWIRSSITMTRNPSTDDIEGYYYCTNINEDKLKNMMIDNVVNNDYKALICVDMINNIKRIYDPSNPDKMDINNDARLSMKEYVKSNSTVMNEGNKIKNLEFERLKEILNQNGEYVIYSDEVDPNGEKRNIRTIFTYLDKDNELVEMTVTDITDIHEQEEEQKKALEKALKEANVANVAKSEFLSRMSHDIRTPLNAILGLTELAIDEDNVDKKMSEYLNKISISGEYLLSLINDILDMSKIESKKLNLNKSPIMLYELIEDIRGLVNPLAREKGINISMIPNQSEIENLCVFIDKTRTRQIMVNLLSNAIKYTDYGGKVEINIEVISKTERLINYRIGIKDNGVGISTEFLKVMFEPFEQENSSRNPDQKGTGLGLSIVKSLLDMMGGKISVNSKLGEGSEFIVDISFEYTQKVYDNFDNKNVAKNNTESEILNKPVILDNHKLIGKRILLAEDNDLNAEIAIKFLNKKGMIVEHFKDGKKAVEAFEISKQGYYDTILMDIRMPEMDGVDATIAIRGIDRADAKTIPIIAMTADAFEQDARKSKEAGIDDFISKPVNVTKMFQIIEKYIIADRADL